MKKILLATCILTAFAFAITLTQISCQKTTGQTNGNTYVLPPATTSTLGGVIVGSGLTVSSNGTLSVTQSSTTGLTQLNIFLYIKGIDSAGLNVQNTYWIANIDGSNPKQVPINLSAGLHLDDNAKLTPDGKTIIFTVYDKPYPKTNSIYSCSIDGSNLKKLADGTSGGFLKIGGAY